MRTMEDWWGLLQESGAVWQHPGDHRAPHVVLRSGKHSDGFVDTLQFLSETEYLLAVAEALASRLRIFLGNRIVDWVFGSPMAGIPLAVAIAAPLRAQRIGFTEKGPDNKSLLCRFDVPAGSTVILIEEMTTTGGTPQRGIEAIRSRNPDVKIVPWVGAFLSRCGSSPAELTDASLVPIIDLRSLGVEFNEWAPSDCPLCRVGSRAIVNCKRVWPQLLQTITNPEYPIPNTA